MTRNGKFALAGTALAAGAAAWLTLRDRRPYPPVGYPPHDTLKPFADDVWIVDSEIATAAMALPIRMTVVRLVNGELLLHSPTRWTPALAAAIGELGTIAHLVAPNVAHWTRIAGWQRAFPHALTWGAPGLRERGAVQRAELRIDRVLGDAAPPEWRDTLDQGTIRGAGDFCETWWHHRASRTLILTDLVQDMDADRLPPLTAWFARASGGAAATTPRYLRPFLRRGPADTRRAIAAMLALDPERVLFAHGAPFTVDGGARLRRALAWIDLHD